MATPQFKTRNASRMALLAMASFFFLSLFANDAVARRWAIGEKQKLVEARLLDFNGQQVLLGTPNNQQLVVDLADLNADDLKYVQARVELQQSVSNREIQLQQLEQQRLQLLSNYRDQWQVELVAPNGERITRNYYARNNVEAGQLALGDYPVARIGYAKKVRRRNFSFPR